MKTLVQLVPEGASADQSDAGKAVTPHAVLAAPALAVLQGLLQRARGVTPPPPPLSAHSPHHQGAGATSTDVDAAQGVAQVMRLLFY